MTDALHKLVIDCSTGEETVVPLTAEEIAQRQKDAEDWAIMEANRIAELEAKAALKASALAKLTSLGLTEDEANALVK